MLAVRASLLEEVLERTCLGVRLQIAPDWISIIDNVSAFQPKLKVTDATEVTSGASHTRSNSHHSAIRRDMGDRLYPLH